MEIYSARVVVGSNLCRCDVIYHDDEYWLVAEWLDTPSEGWSSPARLVGLRGVDHKILQGNDPRIVVSYSLPTFLFDTQTPLPQEHEYEVWDLPPIRIRDKRGMS
ncbi:hypothetical protein D1224_14415 [Henriciella barbarensis]|uniref:Uncharacterized protein n=1 Tax=Henriciella barbarensis TaxID=86342 RepID=A0A399QRN1_9PROT|nr:hypothetical protein D1224_14415 [Henriciella barbarensis]